MTDFFREATQNPNTKQHYRPITAAMNNYQKSLYDGLMELFVAKRKVFNYIDYKLEETTFRIFRHHRIPNYECWLINDFTLECRGVVFEMDVGNDKPVRLASLPFEKFFTLNENPLSDAANLDLSNPKEILIKEDGSLISTMLLPSGKLHLRSKNTLNNHKAMTANELIRSPKWKVLHDWTLGWAKRGFTVIFEYTSPDNQIVVPYCEPALTILAIRNHTDGTYVDLFCKDIQNDMPADVKNTLAKNLFCNGDVSFALDGDALVQYAEGQSRIEGYVVRLRSGQRIKLKTDWYNTRHVHRACQGNDLSDVALAQAVLDDIIDDVRAMNSRSSETLQRIDKITVLVSDFYNETVDKTTSFFQRNGRHLDRSQYAMLAKKQLTGFQLRIAMKLYEGENVDFTEGISQHLKGKGVMQQLIKGGASADKSTCQKR